MSRPTKSLTFGKDIYKQGENEYKTLKSEFEFFSIFFATNHEQHPTF